MKNVDPQHCHSKDQMTNMARRHHAVAGAALQTLTTHGKSSKSNAKNEIIQCV